MIQPQEQHRSLAPVTISSNAIQTYPLSSPFLSTTWYTVCYTLFSVISSPFCGRCWEAFTGHLVRARVSDLHWAFPPRTLDWHPRQNVLVVSAVSTVSHSSFPLIFSPSVLECIRMTSYCVRFLLNFAYLNDVCDLDWSWCSHLCAVG